MPMKRLDSQWLNKKTEYSSVTPLRLKTIKEEDLFTSKLRLSMFDNPIPDKDLNEYTLNLAYNFQGVFENLSVSVDFSVLDFENDQRDATDLRSRLIYSF